MQAKSENHKTMGSDHEEIQDGPGLIANEFQRVSENGFGNPYNSYAHSLAWFRDHLYVGTTRAPLAHRGRQRAEDHPDWIGRIWPVRIPEGLWDIDLRAEIWRFHPPTNKWSKVFTSPLVEGMDGYEVPLTVALRSMTTFQGISDSAPALYVPTMATHQTGTAVMLRSADGIHFEVGTEEGLGISDPYKPRGVRALTTFKGRLFIAPSVARQRKSYNFPELMVVLVTVDPARAKWQLACEPHFGNPNNLTAFQLATFNGYLYAGTANIQEGFQVWKTDAEGDPPYRWKKVISHGAYRGKLNQGAITLQPFRDGLYVGTGIQEGGYDRNNNVGPAAVELIRINPDDSWDLIVGEPRLTPDGFKVPLSGLGPGFGKPFAGYLWSMCSHEGWLYAGTLDWLVGIRYGRRDLWPEHIRRIFSRKRVEQIIDKFGGFDLWRSRDGCRWIPVTQNGFRNPFNIGVRTMISTPHGLFVGTANPFAPEVAGRRVVGWNYEDNPRGGLEIWLGSNSSASVEPAMEGVLHSIKQTRIQPARCKTKETDEEIQDRIIGQFYGGSDFRQFGYWQVGIKDARTACENLMDEILAFIPEKEGTIVDIGCGLGATTRHLLKCFPAEAVTGVTTEKRFLRACQEKAPGVKFILRKLPKVRLRRESFDVVIWVKGLLPLGERSKLLWEGFKLLRPGGRLVCFDVTQDGSHRYPFPKGGRPEKGAVRSMEHYQDLVYSAGFGEVHISDVTEASLLGFRKHVALHFGLRKLSGEFASRLLEEAEAHLRAVELSACKGLLICGCKPDKVQQGSRNSSTSLF